MKKNYLKKVVSVFAATTVLAMASSVMSAFAADDSLTLVIPEKNVTVGTKTVDMELAIAGDSKLTANSIGLMITYDPALKYVSSKSDVFSSDHITSKPETNKLMFSKGGETQYGTGVKLITVTFEVPQVAGKYDVKWVEFAGKNFFNTDVDPDTLVSTVNDDGYIQVNPVTTNTTTTPAPTPTTVTTTTPAPTPTTVVTTTTAPTPTTSVVPTTSKAPVITTTGAKVTKDTAKNSPATGTSSNGVAALAATMVVAAGAAVVLKKKKD